MYGTGLLKGLGITLGHTFEKEITQQYPEQMPVLPQRFRGSLQFKFEDCIACEMCTKACPNHVLSLESFRDEVTNKKKLLSYTIDFQYCMYCNFCVETCPKHCLSFDHNFELAAYSRDEIKKVYQRPREMDAEPPAEIGVGGEQEAAAAAQQQRQITAMIGALQKNGPKVLNKFLENEQEAETLAKILAEDEKKLERLAALMVGDKEKAKTVAEALVKHEKTKGDKKKEGDGVA